MPPHKPSFEVTFLFSPSLRRSDRISDFKLEPFATEKSPKDKMNSRIRRLLIPAFHRTTTIRSDVLFFIFNTMQRGGSVYILTNEHHTVFYTGVSSDILSRVIQHREKHFPSSFTARYNIYKLVYFENLPFIEEAIIREKQVKKYSRKKKIELIEKLNPEWKDLYEDIKNW